MLDENKDIFTRPSFMATMYDNEKYEIKYAKPINDIFIG